jgi:tetratricopeptide (TPR) repeat protein
MMHLVSALADWYIPELPVELGLTVGHKPDLEAVRNLVRRRLAGDVTQTGRMQIVVSDWLYDLVRGNVRRGRAFELAEVLSIRHADCLGYTRLFSALGDEFGLELGVVEVLIDNAGRYVPHHVNLLNLADGTYRFIDVWYGSRNVSHRRIGALVDGKLRDIDREELSGVNELRGLPEVCLEAITLYIKGNRRLERNELDKAIEYYSAAIELYPSNSRAYYNRAIARERKGELATAQADYAQALHDESSLIRVLATTVELEGLIKLDEKSINEQEQAIYLCYQGFQTGAPVGYEEIGRQYGISPEEVKEIITRVEKLCTD